LSVTTTGSVNLSGQRINFNGATTGNFQHTGGTFKIQSIGLNAEGWHTNDFPRVHYGC
jgi:hypothetical protein